MANILQIARAKRKIKSANRHGVRSLNLSGLSLTTADLEKLMPKITKALPNLSNLDLSFNKLTAIPQEIGNFQNIFLLNLSFNKLTAIPHEIGNLQNLQILNLNSNQLTVMPQEIENLESLRTFSLTQNPLSFETRSFLDSIVRNNMRVSYDLPTIDVEANYRKVLGEIYPNEQIEILTSKIDALDTSWSFFNGKEEVIEAQKELLEIESIGIKKWIENKEIENIEIDKNKIDEIVPKFEEVVQKNTLKAKHVVKGFLKKNTPYY